MSRVVVVAVVVVVVGLRDDSCRDFHDNMPTAGNTAYLIYGHHQNHELWWLVTRCTITT